MKILVVDDEKRVRESTIYLLKQYCPEMDEILEAEGVRSATELLKEHRPDGALLDIQLKDGSGFDLIPRLRELNIPVVFVTAFEQFAIRAFKVSALDYLLKPIDPDELVQAVKRFSESEGITEDKLEVYQQVVKEEDKFPDKIVLRTSGSIFIVDTRDIIYCEADKNYTTFHIKGRPKILVSRNIGEYEELLANGSFMRIHQSVLFNLNYLERYEKGEGGSVITTFGQELPVASRKKELLMKYLNSLG